MKITSFKWGIIGAGKIAGKFAKDLATVPGAELYAVASRTKSKAEKFATDFGFERSYGSYEALVNDDEVTVIYIATPHVFHCEHTLLCLNKKKAVLCEKPFAMDTSQVEQMITAAQGNNVFLMEAMWTYFLPHYQYLLKLVETQKFGKVLELEADFGFKADFLPEKRLYNKSLGGGSLLDIGIYPVFAALSLLGIPEKIEAKGEFCETEVDESIEIEFNYKGGISARLASSINRETPTTAIILFEKAKVTLKNRFHEPTSILIEQKGKEEEIDFGVDAIGYSFEAEHVQEMLHEGRKESNVMTFEMSRKLIGLLDRIREKIKLEY